jgi:CubicO group peptidase (beta-lactamase class C family)
MTAVSAPGVLGGECTDRFGLVREEFERNFAERGEVGAAVAVYLDGELVIDLWGGVARQQDNKAWSAETTAVLQSGTKGAAALVAHILISRGQLDPDAPVATYWPGFGCNGKENIPLRWILSHQGGVPSTTEVLPDGTLLDHDAYSAAIARITPRWEPGTRHGYHAMTFGFIVGEIVSRVTGRSIGTFFRDEIAEPLGLDFWIGMPAQFDERVAVSIAADPPAPDEPVLQVWINTATPGTIQFDLAQNAGSYYGAGATDSRSAYAAENPSAGGIATARSLAKMYAPLSLDGSLFGVRLLQPADLPRLINVEAAGVDAFVLIPTRFSLGYWKSVDNRRAPTGGSSMRLSETAFGHPGYGGRIGFADPQAHLAFGYINNKLGSSLSIDDRAQALIDATYRSLGYTEDVRGLWSHP